MVVMGKGVRRAGRLPRIARGLAAAAAVAVLAGTAAACSSGDGPGTGTSAEGRPDGEVRTSPIADRGRFAEYHAAVFASQPQGAFTDARLLEIAAKVPGLRGADFDRAVRDMTYRDWAVRSEEAFEATGAQGTPLVLVDGKPVGVQDRSMFDAKAFAESLRGVGIA
ncbi:DsbA family protein [Streptomyces sp. NPDC101118]|uniref:DsbA family protein n=1 Tax=Streptomyces sp. NPDC101118 TaxID=3366109 RepID=UPI0038256F5D